jgi:hephaestin
MTGHTVKLSLCIVALLLCPAIASTQTMTNMASKTGGASPQISPGRTHTYYIAADDVTWDYVPGGVDVITGQPFKSFGSFQVAGKHVDRPVPTTYLKTLYREYTDATFKTLKPRTPEWEHLGFLGPLIRAEVGDTIQVIFRNNSKRPYSMHPHGVFYNKDSEGAPYEDGTSGADKADDGVPPGGPHKYTWQVPERAGPASGDVNSVLWMYHSHVDEHRDPNTGLVGPMIITARGQAKPDGTPQGVDREFVVMFVQDHEEDSWHAEENLPANMATEPALLVLMTPFSATGTYPYFVTFSLNGYEHGTMPLRALTMHKGEHSAGMYSPAPTTSTPTRRTGTATPSSSIRCAPTSPRWHPCRWSRQTWCPTTSASGSSTATFPSTAPAAWSAATPSPLSPI